MRLLSLVFSFLIAVTVVLASLIYLEQRLGEQRIYVQEGWLSSSDSAHPVPAEVARRPPP